MTATKGSNGRSYTGVVLAAMQRAQSQFADTPNQTSMPVAMGTTQLDPKSIQPSRWANRHPSSYADGAFDLLKREIADSGGNVQPIKVRRTDSDRYEIVFGHRRHQACLELGLPVLATVVSDMDDHTLWQEMERENRARKDLTPFEQGRHYRAALDSGLFPSIRRLAAAVGVDVSQAAKVIRIADLPVEVLSAFRSPCDIQVNWATKLHAALDREPDGVRKHALKLATQSPKSTSKQAFTALTSEGLGVEPFHTPREITNAKSGARATITDVQGGYIVRIAGDVSAVELEAALRRLLKA